MTSSMQTPSSEIVQMVWMFQVVWRTYEMLWKYRSEVKFVQSCPTLCDPMDYTVRGILQARILESVVAFPFSRGSSQPRDWTQVSTIAGGFFTSWTTRELLAFLISNLRTFRVINSRRIPWKTTPDLVATLFSFKPSRSVIQNFHWFRLTHPLNQL